MVDAFLPCLTYYFDTLLPRIPVPILRQITTHLERLKLPTSSAGVTGTGGRHAADDTARRPPSVKASLSVSFGQRAPHRASTRGSSPVRRNVPGPRESSHHNGDDRREKENEKSKDYERCRLKDRGGERPREADWGKDRHREREWSRDYDRDDRRKGRDRDYDSGRDRDHGRERGDSRDYSRDRERDRESDKERYRERGGDRERDCDKYRDRDRRQERHSRIFTPRVGHVYRSRSRSPGGHVYRSQSRSPQKFGGSGSTDMWKSESPAKVSATNLTKLRDLYGDATAKSSDTNENSYRAKDTSGEDVIRLGGRSWQ